jgi:hypothetical protein
LFGEDWWLENQRPFADSVTQPKSPATAGSDTRDGPVGGQSAAGRGVPEPGVSRLGQAQRQAEEIVLHEKILLKPEPEADQTRTRTAKVVPPG